MKKLLILFASASLLFITSCGNDDDNSSSFELDCTYLKVREGSTFTTKLETTGSAPQSITSEIIESEEIDGVLVAVAESDSGAKSYLTCEGDKFIVTAQETTTIETNVTIKNVLLELDFGRTIGETYTVGTIVSSSSIQGYDFDIINRYEGMVLEKDLSMTVEGIAYTDVVKFEMVSFTENSLGGGEFKTTKTIYYVAPEVATILTEIYDELGGFGLISTATLVEFNY